VPGDYSQFVAAHRERRLLEQQRAVKSAELAWQAAREAADRLVARLGVSRVLLFGSLARDAFTAHSDIDLAVEGLTAGMLVDAQAIAEDNCPFSIDVLPLDAARPDVANTIRREGVVLWPR